MVGHAELSGAGTDILCAALSVLAENLGSSLKELLGLPLEIRKGSGLYSFSLEQRQRSQKSDLLFSSALLGFRVLQNQYPDRIELSF